MADTDALLTAAEAALTTAQAALADLRAALAAPVPPPVPPVPDPDPVPPPPASPISPALAPMPADATVATAPEAVTLAHAWAADWHGTGPDADRTIVITGRTPAPLDLSGIRVPRQVRIAAALPDAPLSGLVLTGAANLAVAGFVVGASIMALGCTGILFEDVTGLGSPMPGQWGSTAPGSYGWMIDQLAGVRASGIVLRRCGAARYTGKAVLIRQADDILIDGLICAEGHSDDIHVKDVKRLRIRDFWASRRTTAPAAEHLDPVQGTRDAATGRGGEDVTLEDSVILPRPVVAKPYMQGPFLDDAAYNRTTIRDCLIMPNNLNGVTVFGPSFGAVIEDNFVGRQPGTVNINAKHSIIRTVGGGATVRRNVEARDNGAAVGGRALMHPGGNFGVYRQVFEAPSLFAAGTGIEEARPVRGGGMHWDDPAPDGCWRLLARIFRDSDHPGKWGTAAAALWRADYDPTGVM